MSISATANNIKDGNLNNVFSEDQEYDFTITFLDPTGPKNSIGKPANKAVAIRKTFDIKPNVKNSKIEEITKGATSKAERMSKLKKAGLLAAGGLHGGCEGEGVDRRNAAEGYLAGGPGRARRLQRPEVKRRLER